MCHLQKALGVLGTVSVQYLVLSFDEAMGMHLC